MSLTHLLQACVFVSFQEAAGFSYIDVWSSRFTWGGLSPPETGTFAVITKGQTILLDTSTPVLKMLLIQGEHVHHSQTRLVLLTHWKRPLTKKLCV